MREIFENEGEAHEVLSKTTGNWESDLQMLKRHGYLKDPVQKAEEIHNLWIKGGSRIDDLTVISQLFEAIQHLKKERL